MRNRTIYQKKYVDSLNSSEVGLILKIDINKSTSFENKYNGYKLYLINKTNNTVGLDASDSRLDIVGEVFYKGKWQAIEYLPSSTCGNSYHTVFLKQMNFGSLIYLNLMEKSTQNFAIN